ncbi:ABC transporter substrate-binding protein [Streptomyces sp. UG1]|uniref:ABC transporter substrate-binding protein n=1 Tax=Streptomyces sp. UG1 TaxID=3417652 RepID=UPI003CF17DF9
MKVTRSLIATAATALLLSACNDSTNAGSSSAGSDGPFKLLVISQLDAAAFSFPEIEYGAKSSASATNAAGGIGGHKVQVDVCNDQGDPNVAATCGRKAVQGGYAAVVNTTSLYAASFMPLLESGKVPAVGGTPLTAPDFTSKMSFPIAGGNPLDYGGVGFVAAKGGCKTAAVIRDTAAAVDASTKAIKAGFQAAGGTAISDSHVIKLAGTSPDFSGPVSQVVSSGVQCLLVAEQPQALPKIIGAVRQSAKPRLPVHTLAVAFPKALVTSLGKAADGVVVNDSIAIPSQTGTPSFWADMEKYAPKADKTGHSLRGWAAVQVIAQVAKEAKAYDHSSLLAALQKATGVKAEGLAASLDFSQPNTKADVARVFAKKNFAYTVGKGDYNPLFGGKPVDVSAALR